MEHPAPAPSRTLTLRRNIGRFVPILIIVLFALFILKEEVPLVNRWFQSIFSPERYAAAEVCRRAALNASAQPDYARVRDAGAVHETQYGYYVEGVIIGEMGEDGAEKVYRFNCYTDPAGKLVKTHKDEKAAGMPAP